MPDIERLVAWPETHGPANRMLIAPAIPAIRDMPASLARPWPRFPE